MSVDMSLKCEIQRSKKTANQMSIGVRVASMCCGEEVMHAFE